MAYINFKEEKVVAEKQLDKRKHNNENMYGYILKHKDSLSGYFPSEKYSYTRFNDKIIGKKDILGEEDFLVISDEDIVCSKFTNCKFTNVKFKSCRFVACTFDSCEFSAGGVIFENCILIKEDSDKLPALNRKDNLSCRFYNCSVYAKFLNSDISYVIFEESKIDNTSFEQSSMKNIIINKSEIKNIKIEDCDFSGGKIISTYIVDFEFNDKSRTKFDEKTFFDKIQPRVKDKAEYEGIYMTYETIANKFKENTLNNNFGEYYYLGKCTERKCIPIIPRIWSYIYWLVCGYGERAEYALLSGIVIMLIFSVIYLFTGVEINGENVNYTISTLNQITISKLMRDLNETITLSVGVFGGVGAINCNPTETSYFVSHIEIILGIVMMGIGIGALTRKIIR
ncbi:MAG: pentapeptide repeat-containing protein [Romboutsia sp.]